jgi:3-dehydroquinate synthetase/ABC-type branched-subunit amino acid transport system ATPase component
MGALPPVVVGDGPPITYVRGDEYEIAHVADGLSAGLVAVFQDDNLIPSMTIKDQLCMRHMQPTWLQMREVVRNFVFQSLTGNPAELAPDLPENHWLFRLLRPNEQLLYPKKELLERATNLLQFYGEEYVKILEKFPRDLSGGARAVARLVSAQLSRKVAVLFLDEAFTGVQRDVWPRLLERLIQWAEACEAAIVSVSHNTEELIRWQPRARFVISNKRIVTERVHGYYRLVPALPSRVTSFPIFKPPYNSLWLETAGANAVLFAERGLDNTKPFKELVAAISHQVRSPPTIMFCESSESHKNLDTYKDLLRRIYSVLPRPDGLIVIAGGGVLLNLAGFAAATAHRGAIPFVLVPTSVMAMADVAVGSKTGLNAALDDGKGFAKHAIGVYADPSAVILDPRFLETLPQSEKLIGLAECLKHGILQSESLFHDVAGLIAGKTQPVMDCFSVAERTMLLKLRVLARDPWELDTGRILLYGHLHSASIERASDLAVSHGVAVYVGILLDLLLAGNRTIFDSVFELVRKSGVVDWDALSVLKERLHAAYSADMRCNVEQHEVIRLNSIGQYGELAAEPLQDRRVSWGDILGAWSTLEEKVLRSF